VKPDGRKTSKWDPFFEYEGHDGSVNSVCWAPPDWGLMLACASSDSTITVLSSENGRFVANKICGAHSVRNFDLNLSKS